MILFAPIVYKSTTYSTSGPVNLRTGKSQDRKIANQLSPSPSISFVMRSCTASARASRCRSSLNMKESTVSIGWMDYRRIPYQWQGYCITK